MKTELTPQELIELNKRSVEAGLNAQEAEKRGRMERAKEDLSRHPLPDADAQRIRENWVKDSFDESKETLDQIGVIWMEEVLGVDSKTIERFKNEDAFAQAKVGYLQAGVYKNKMNLSGFWEKVERQAPKLVSLKDLPFLIQHDRMGNGGWLLICDISMLTRPRECTLLDDLITNAILYK